MTTTPPDPQTPAPAPLPPGGGSYTRQPDGTLQRNPAPAPPAQD